MKKNVAGNKQFWRTVKTVLSDKMKPDDKIFLVKYDEIINEVTRLNKMQYNGTNPRVYNITYPAVKLIF